MKTKVVLCKELGILDDIRHGFLRICQDDPKSWDQIDEKINKLTNDEIIERWSTYEIGDDWWTKMKRMFDYLEKGSKPISNADTFTPTAKYKFL